MTAGICYLLMGTRHLTIMAVSAMTLRDWWQGEATIFAEETAREYADKIGQAAGIDVVAFEPVKQRRHSGYASKTLLPSLSPYDETIQLDADTVVVGALDEMQPETPEQIVLTPFAHWTTGGRIVSSRVRKWADVAPELVAQSLSEPMTAINTGSLSYGNECFVARQRWHEMTMRKPREFISDEVAMQLLAADPELQPYIRMLDVRYNWSPMLAAPNDDVRIEHYHGAKAFKRRAGLVKWYPAFMRAYRDNFAGIRDWFRADTNRHWQRLLKANPGFLENSFDPGSANTAQG